MDRATHEQPIGLGDSESRICWLGIAGCITVLASECVSAVACEGAAITKIMSVEEIAIKSVTVVSCVVNGLGVVNGMAHIIEKINKETVTSLDIFQLSSAVLFFTNSVISAHKAFSLLKTIKENATLGSSGDVSIFNKNSLNSVITTGAINGGSLCTGLIKKFVEPETTEMICKWVYEKLSVLVTCLLQTIMDKSEYVKEVFKVVQEFWDKWNEEINFVITRICKAFGVKHWSDIIVNGRRGLQGSNMRKLCNTVITETRVSEQSKVIPKSNDNEENRNDPDEGCSALPFDEIFNIHAKFVDLQNCKNAVEFCELMKFVCKFVKDEIAKEELSYEKMWNIAQKLKPDVNVKDFDEACGISGNRNDHFLQTVFNKFKDGETEGLNSLKLAYDSQKAVMSKQKESEQSFCERVTFDIFSNKEGLAPNGMLSKEQYCDIARELTKKHDGNENISIIQKGSTAVILMNLSEFVITVQSYPEQEHGRVSGIAAMLHSPLNSEN
jgi:hypothetical protein